MEKSFPFNAALVDGVPDRVYSAEDFAAERAAYVSNGVTARDALTVTPGAAGGLCVDVAPGLAVIDGYTYRNTTPLTLTLAAADALYPRTDLAVLRLDLIARQMHCVLLSGTPSQTPAEPSLSATENIREIPLARIRVAAGETVLEADHITDLRPRASYILNHMDVEAVLDEYRAALNEMFQREDAEALADAASVLRTDGTPGEVLCADGLYRNASDMIGGRTELCRFTESGTFCPADYPTADGRYDIVLQGGGGSGAAARAAEYDNIYGGSAGGYMSLTGLTLIPDMEYTVTVGKGGEALPRGTGNGTSAVQSPGKDGGDTSFWNYTVPGGKGGTMGEHPQPLDLSGFAVDTGSAGEEGRGGDSHFARGGKNGCASFGATRTAEDGYMGSGGGSVTKYDLYVGPSGAGGDGVVIIYGIPV